MKRFKKARSARYRKERNEGHDCTVIALSILGRMSYADAHQYCKAAGRQIGKGMYIDEQLEAYKAAGLIVERVGKVTRKSVVTCFGNRCPPSPGETVEVFKDLRQPNGCKYTPKTIGERLKKGYYLCRCNKHVFSVVNGDVEDWTKDRKHHITEVYKITKPKRKV